MPITCGVNPSNCRLLRPGPGSVMRKTVLLVIEFGLIALSNGIPIRGCKLKPSSWFTSVMSAQSDGLVAQLGNGRFTRNPVSCWPSKAAKRSLGKGDVAGELRLNTGCVAAAASAGNNTIVATTIMVRLTNEYFSFRGICMAVKHLQGSCTMVVENLRPSGKACQC